MREKAFLVRGPKGTMSTIWATSFRAAMDAYLRKHRLPKGSYVDIKLRGEGDWKAYEVL
jgi:hypothetical protein